MNAVEDQTRYVQDLINAASVGETVFLPRGVYGVALYIDKSLILVGEGKSEETVLQGLPDGGSVIVIQDNDLEIALENLTIAGGADLRGGGITLKAASKLMIKNCTLCNNAATYYGGGGVYAQAGELIIERSRIYQNAGVSGGGVFLDTKTKALFKSCLIVENNARFGGGVCLKEAASAEFLNCTFAENRSNENIGDNIFLSGSLTEQPAIKLMNCIVAKGGSDQSIAVNDCGARISVLNTLMASELQNAFSIEHDENNLYAPVIFTAEGQEKYKLSSDSPGRYLGTPIFLQPADRDILGTTWRANTAIKAGIAVGAFASRE